MEVPPKKVINKIESGSEPEVLSADEKKNLGEAWVEMVVGKGVVPKNIQEMSDEELKEWLFVSLMEGVGDFIEVEGIKTDDSLVEKIIKEENPEERSRLEMEYLKNIQEEIGKYLEVVYSRGEPTKWDSWPKLMKENHSFNCAGAAMVGAYFLENAGIKSFVGNPYEHIVNIVELSNGKTVYTDFTHGEDVIHEVTEEDSLISETRILMVSNPSVEYTAVPVFELEEFPEIILGNLNSIGRVENKETEDPKNREKAKAYRGKYGVFFERTDFSVLGERLYPEISRVCGSVERKEEGELVGIIRSATNILQSYFRELSLEERINFREEVKIYRDSIVIAIETRDESILDGISEGLTDTLIKIIQILNTMEKENPHLVPKAIGNIVSRIKGIK